MHAQNELYPRWMRLCRDLNIDEAYARTNFELLAKRYGETHRAYHTLTHISECLKQFDVLRDLCENPLAVELAIWFHDIVYIPEKGSKSEEKSALLAVTFLSNAKGMDEKMMRVVIACIHATIPGSQLKSNDEAVMMDVDLVILGQPESSYNLYTQAIRKEYAHVPQLIYSIVRRSVMSKFIDSRPYIYFTPFMRENLELQARANIERELRTLSFF